MRVGLHALGIGTGARPEVIRAVAMAAEAAGFATLWAGEHVVLVDEPQSRYPYSADGRIAVPAAADWLDPLLGLSFIAAELAGIGVTEFVVVAAPPDQPAAATVWVKQLAAQWGVTPGR
jgi:alkanesulfonate monooxygenase SsuD/methylene tetrahydromethanopterin reductase-like flavin-dependent oxidoreductase (luciferase family)